MINLLISTLITYSILHPTDDDVMVRLMIRQEVARIALTENSSSLLFGTRGVHCIVGINCQFPNFLFDVRLHVHVYLRVRAYILSHVQGFVFL